MGATIVLSGCASTNDDPQYTRSKVNNTAGKPRTAKEMVAAEAVAQQDPDENASPIDSLTLDTHEFVVKDSYKGPTVQGTVSNTGRDLLTYAEVRVRVYDDTGAQLGLYLDSTDDFSARTAWQFEVVLLTSVSKIASYDIALLGIPG
ncbi:FxLYD domain-containing protein [Haladaptatus halobius]|uniref:FxLYD domain-containing protein n=1 Tax=Haladaptatus halobius TaxID=2884875 RepID=UPI001D0A2B94|nr:FxLYD domain-containing protein [Haladaptatus halobius]